MAKAIVKAESELHGEIVDLKPWDAGYAKTMPERDFSAMARGIDFSKPEKVKTSFYDDLRYIESSGRERLDRIDIACAKAVGLTVAFRNVEYINHLVNTLKLDNTTRANAIQEQLLKLAPVQMVTTEVEKADGSGTKKVNTLVFDKAKATKAQKAMDGNLTAYTAGLVKSFAERKTERDFEPFVFLTELNKLLARAHNTAKKAETRKALAAKAHKAMDDLTGIETVEKAVQSIGHVTKSRKAVTA